VSHQPERTAKNCLNCGHTVLGRYCQVCGQENLEPKETFWHLVSHFIEDITHFDGKFFSTLKFLLFRPGFLSAEYVRGRRMSYLHPIRMYVFTSFVFFLIVYSMTGWNGKAPKDKSQDEFRTFYARQAHLQEELAAVRDSDRREEIRDSLEDTNDALQSLSVVRDFTDSSGKGTTKIHFYNTGLGGDSIPSTVAEYDSIQAHIPASKRQPWFYRIVNRRVTAAFEDFHADKRHFEMELWERIQHTFPKILFVSLPLFALFLRLLNLRRRKTILYADHGIFTIHLYCATFIIMLAMMLINDLEGLLGWNWMSWIVGLLFISAFFYEYKAMRGFYKQGRGKTILKFLLLNIAATLLIGILTIVFAAWAIFEV
jgi:hypothetical protein